MDEQTVTIGGQEVRLSAPASEAIRTEIAFAAGGNYLRGSWAALGACWRGKGRPAATYAQARHDPLVYGAMVYDELRARGIPRREIATAAAVALALVSSDILDGREVTEKEGFTGRTPGDSTS